MEKTRFGHWCVKSTKSHEKLKRMKVILLVFEIFFQKGLTRFFHERGVLHVKCVGLYCKAYVVDVAVSLLNAMNQNEF